MRNDRWMTWASFGLVIVIVWIGISVYIPALCEPKRPFLDGLLIRWNPAASSVPSTFDYSNNLKTVIWDPSNPSYENCTKHNGPQYRPDSELAGYNPVPDSYPSNPQPYCWSCHSNSYAVYYNYTALAHPGGNPVGFGEQ